MSDTKYVKVSVDSADLEIRYDSTTKKYNITYSDSSTNVNTVESNFRRTMSVVHAALNENASQVSVKPPAVYR